MNQDKIKFGNEAETQVENQNVQNEQDTVKEQEDQAITQEPEAVEQVILDEVELPFEDNNEFESKIAALEAALLASEEKVRAQQDEVLRSRADVENMRRRTEQEIEKARKFALERFVGELLPVIDNLERATELADKDDEALKPMLEGVELTLKTMKDTVERFGLKEIDPQGEAFDPTFHQAMSIQESADFAPNTVMMVMQKGYVLNGRVVRPAMVMVSKAAAGNVDETV